MNIPTADICRVASDLAAELIDRERTERLEIERIQTFRGYSVAFLRVAFERVKDKLDWKAGWTAEVHHWDVGATIAAVEFFHSDCPTVVCINQLSGKVVMRGRGYRA